MNFMKHSDLEGKHAFLSPSKNAWLNYSQEKLAVSFKNSYAQSIGTTLHEFAAKRIKYRMRLRKTDKDSMAFYMKDAGLPDFVIEPDKYYNNLMAYVNDAIGYRMTPEQPLYYSENCFGTADAISIRNGLLRIHDLKTGSSPVSMAQLELYTALFFLEYPEYSLTDCKVECRIYKSDEVLSYEPTADSIGDCINKIVSFDHQLKTIMEG